MSQAIPYNRDRTSPEASLAMKPFDTGGANLEAVRLTAQIKRLIWLYFWLLILEGALRKWVVPSLANPILLIRDPIVIVIYYKAFRLRRLPHNSIMMGICCLAWLSLAVGLMVQSNVPVVLYGFRANFLHLPLIYVMPMFFGRNDVRLMGRWLLLISIPMALLMTLQFTSPGASWINAGSDEAFKQISTARGHIRAPGTFSFISGPIFFYALTTAYLLEGLFISRQYPRWLVIASGLAVGLGAMVSGSRSVVIGVGIVFVCAILCGTVIQPRFLYKTVQSVAFVCILGGILVQLPVIGEGVATITERFTGKDVTQGDFSSRIQSGLTLDPQQLYEAPLWGEGLGTGTNVGATLLAGARLKFHFAENEWERSVNECGPILGLLFILLRCLVVIELGKQALAQAQKENVLPLLLFGSGAMALLNGQWGQATTLGFSILAGGLCLSAMKEEVNDEHLDTHERV